MILRTSGLVVGYRYAGVAVHGVSLDVAPGSIVAVLGPNGAGKTTTLRAITGFRGEEPGRVLSGEVEFDGRPITGLAPHVVARRGARMVFERDSVFRSLTVQENLDIVRGARGARRRELLDTAFELFPVLAERRNQSAGTLSGGEARMLALSTGLLTDGKLLVCDEISSGVAPIVVTRLMSALRDISARTGAAVLLAEQHVGSALDIADHVYVMASGRITHEGTPAALIERGILDGLYLSEASV